MPFFSVDRFELTKGYCVDGGWRELKLRSHFNVDWGFCYSVAADWIYQATVSVEKEKEKVRAETEELL
jgi:hypothetical protein